LGGFHKILQNHSYCEFMFWHLVQVLVEKIGVPDSGVRAQVAAQDSPLGETTIPCATAVDRGICNLFQVVQFAIGFIHRFS
jgi:hypothetical protein